MFTNSPNEIEASDIDAVRRVGDAIPLGDGRIALPVHLIVSSESGKTYAGEDFPVAIHLTNGVQVRRLDIVDNRPVLSFAPGLTVTEPAETQDAENEADVSTAEAEAEPPAPEATEAPTEAPVEAPVTDAAAESDSAESDAAAQDA